MVPPGAGREPGGRRLRRTREPRPAHPRAYCRAAYRGAYQTDPGYYSVGAYTAGLFLKHALEKVGGRVEDTDAFLKALRSVAILDAPGGPIRLDRYGNPVHNIYIRRVERREGRLQNVVIHTIENVSQFGRASCRERV
mgnify:CR=1 FL=1